MKDKNIIIAVTVVALLVIVGLGFALVGNSKPNSNDSMTNMPTTTKSTTTTNASDTTATNTTPAVANSITIENYKFSPASMTVKVGTKVTWTNQDTVSHTVTVDSGDGPNSQLFGKGQSYSFTFTKAGTYSYHCAPHPYMKGTITVTE